MQHDDGSSYLLVKIFASTLQITSLTHVCNFWFTPIISKDFEDFELYGACLTMQYKSLD
jgi:hypothetical protein